MKRLMHKLDVIVSDNVASRFISEHEWSREVYDCDNTSFADGKSCDDAW